MFNLPAPNKKQLQKLTVKEALRKDPKPSACWITPVKWSGYSPEYLPSTKEFHSSPLAIPPKLPHGYAMDFHTTWEEASIEVNDQMVALCKGGNIHEIYKFDKAFHAYLKDLKKDFSIKLLSYHDGSFDGHEEPDYPKNLGRYTECQDINTCLQEMTGAQMYRQIANMHSQGSDTTFWVNEKSICGVTVDGRLVPLKDSTLPKSLLRASVF